MSAQASKRYRGALGKGMTPKQSHLLAGLKKEAGEPWLAAGQGMTRLQASREIERLEQQLGLSPLPFPSEKENRPSQEGRVGFSSSNSAGSAEP